MKIGKDIIIRALESSGFARSPFDERLFTINGTSLIAPAYYLNIVRKRNMIRLGGAIGLYFADFENEWRAFLSREERKIDATLPLIMLIDNYAQLININIFNYTNDTAEIYESAKEIYDLANLLPKTMRDFDGCLLSKEIVYHKISDYTHIFDYNNDKNLYFRKSVEFIHWFSRNHPEYAEHLFDCLTERQKKRISRTAH